MIKASCVILLAPLFAVAQESANFSSSYENCNPDTGECDSYNYEAGVGGNFSFGNSTEGNITVSNETLPAKSGNLAPDWVEK